MIKDLVRSFTKPMGFDIVKYPLSPIGRRLRDFFRESGVNLVIDVGAFDGGFCRLLRTEGEYYGPIISFEPSAKSFEKLQAAMKGDANWKGFRIGLSDQSSSAALRTFSENPDF